MSIDAIGGIGSPIRSLIEQGPAAAPKADFAHLLTDGIGRVDADLVRADRAMAALAAGEDIAVHDLMLSLEQARLSLQFAVEVRNKLVEAYQEMLRMQL